MFWWYAVAYAYLYELERQLHVSDESNIRLTHRFKMPRNPSWIKIKYRRKIYCTNKSLFWLNINSRELQKRHLEISTPISAVLNRDKRQNRSEFNKFRVNFPDVQKWQRNLGAACGLGWRVWCTRVVVNKSNLAVAVMIVKEKQRTQGKGFFFCVYVLATLWWRCLVCFVTPQASSASLWYSAKETASNWDRAGGCRWVWGGACQRRFALCCTVGGREGHSDKLSSHFVFTQLVFVCKMPVALFSTSRNTLFDPRGRWSLH